MPTKNPRLTITLEPTLSVQLRRLSELTGNSQAKIISEILDGSTAVFARLITVLEAAKEATASMKGKAAADLDAAQTRMESQLGLILEDFHESTDTLLKEAEVIKRRATRQPATGGRVRSAGRSAAVVGARQPVVTPPSNRGVRSKKTTEKTYKAGS